MDSRRCGRRDAVEGIQRPWSRVRFASGGPAAPALGRLSTLDKKVGNPACRKYAPVSVAARAAS